MRQHQVFTGSVNLGNNCYSIGRVNNFTFYAYGSGFDLVILTSNQQPLQVITEKNGMLITALDCSESNGEIIVSYGSKIVIYKPIINSLAITFDYIWTNYYEFDVKPQNIPISIVKWNSAANHLLLGSNQITLWNKTIKEIEKETVCKWECIWESSLGSKFIQLDFAPYSQAIVFASLAEKDLTIKVWYQKSYISSTILSYFTYSFLQHPQIVTSFEWRKALYINSQQRSPNILISSSEDHICRLWSETHLPQSHAWSFNLNNHVNSTKAVETKKLSSAITSRHFHLSASINPLTDIPILPFLPDQTHKSQDGYGASIFTVHFLNNKFYKSLSQIQEYSNKSEHSFNVDSFEKPKHLLLPKFIKEIIDTWQKSRDALFAIHPADGSLLMWHIEWLDSMCLNQIRQPQISFSSRIPTAFPVNDARTMSSFPIFFENTSIEQNILHSASCISLKADVVENKSCEKSVYCDYRLLSKHSDGSLNIWQLCFADPLQLLLVSSVFHLTRCCGHCHHLNNIVSHPTLPLVLSSSHYQSSDDKYQSNELILWSVDSIGALSFSGGLSELTKMRTDLYQFDHVTWFPTVFSGLYNYKNNTCVSTALITLHQNSFHIFQTILDARNVLQGLDFCDHKDTFKLVSQQSSTHPGCLLHLHSIEDTENWGEILFLDVFCESRVNDSISDDLSSLVIIAERDQDQTHIHTWRVTFTLPSTQESDQKYSQDSEDTTDTEDEFDSFSRISAILTSMNVKVTKLSKQLLNSLKNLQISSISSTICNDVPGLFRTSWNTLSSSTSYIPYQICVTYTTGEVVFLSANLSSFNYDWKIWNKNIKSPEKNTLILRHQLIYTSFADMTLMGVLYLEETANCAYKLAIYENLSSGGETWKLQDEFTLQSFDTNSSKSDLTNFNMKWLSMENGDFCLAVSFQNILKIFIPINQNITISLKKSPNKSNKFIDYHDESKLHGNYWTQILSFFIRPCSYNDVTDDVSVARGLVISWCFGGLLVVGTFTEMFVFSSWINKDNLKYDQTIVKRDSDYLDTNVFQLANRFASSIPQYHPHNLMELMNSGRFDVVKDILINLAFIINRIKSVDLKSSFSFQDETLDKSEEIFLKFFEPIYLHSLIKQNSKIEGLKYEKNTEAVEDTDQEDLFTTKDEQDDFSTDEELEELLGFTSDKTTRSKNEEIIDLTKMKSGYFGIEHCKVINEYLVHHKLVGVSSLDQMKLMALASTVSLMESSAAGVSDEETVVTSLTTSGRGYATLGGGTSSLDECGLRFVTALHHHFSLIASQPLNRGTKSELRPFHFAWAFHSESEEEILSLAPSVRKGAPKWSELKSLGAGWWIRSKEVLQNLVERLARVSFMENNDPLDAALYYLALNRKKVLCALFKSSKNDKFFQFFSHDFTEERWKKAAMTNGYALLGLQRFAQAAAFFLLANATAEAIDVCVTKMHDLQLALVIARLLRHDDVEFHRVLRKFITADDVISDCFFRSIAHWMLGDYNRSIDVLLEDSCADDVTDRCDFYFFLSSHPLLMKLQRTSDHQMALTKARRSKERDVIFQTAIHHLRSGQALMTLNVLQKLAAISCDTDDDVTVEVAKSVEVIDWSQPEVEEEDELQLSWSDDEMTSQASADDVTSISADVITTVAAPRCDAFIDQIRKIAVWKILLEEMTSLAHVGCHSNDQKMRESLFKWLQRSVSMMNRLFAADDVVDDVIDRPAWLRRHRSFIWALTSHCRVHESSLMTSLKVELLMLLQESLQDATMTSHPLPLIRVLSTRRSFLYDALRVLDDVTSDILRYVLSTRREQSTLMTSSQTTLLCRHASTLSTLIGQLLNFDDDVTTDNDVTQNWQVDWMTSDRRAKLMTSLCEAVVAIYISLMVTAMNSDDVITLLRLNRCEMNEEGWKKIVGETVLLRHSVISFPTTSVWRWLLGDDDVIEVTDDVSESDDDVSEADDDVIEVDDDVIDADLDTTSYSWRLLKLVIVEKTLKDVKMLIGIGGIDLKEINSHSSLLAALLRSISCWQQELVDELESSSWVCVDELLPNCGASGESGVRRPALFRYQAILEADNTPFEGKGHLLRAAKQLWCNLVATEALRSTFIKYIFHFQPTSLDQDKNQLNCGNEDMVESGRHKIRIVHKDVDIVTSFCINNVSSNSLSVASSKDLQEIELTSLLASDWWVWIDDIEDTSSPSNNKIISEDYSKTMSWPDTGLPHNDQGVSVLVKRPIPGIKRMDAHPTLPYYVIGARDGGVSIWEWGHQHRIGEYRPSGLYSKVCNLYFSKLGNKLAAVDGDGYLSLWQVGRYRKPCFQHLCHNRITSDCCFVSSSTTCIATCGMSSNHKNIAIWDTLMPKKSVLIKDFIAFENTGVSCIEYMNDKRCLIAGSKSGHIVVYDERCLQSPLHSYTAHDTSIKCITIDQSRGVYITGSANGEMKIWDCQSHALVFANENQHPRSSLFRNFGSGMMQAHVTDDYLFTCGADGTLKMTFLSEVL